MTYGGCEIYNLIREILFARRNLFMSFRYRYVNNAKEEQTIQSDIIKTNGGPSILATQFFFLYVPIRVINCISPSYV